MPRPSFLGGVGVRLPNGMQRPDHHHTSRGRRMYPKEMRKMVSSIWQAGGYDAIDTPEYNALRALKKIPCIVTCKRWIYIYQQVGNVLPKRLTGHRQFSCEVHDIDLVNLLYFCLVRPNAYINEVRAYVHNRNPANHSYSSSQIHCAEQWIVLWLKVASSTLNEANCPKTRSRLILGTAVPSSRGERTRHCDCGDDTHAFMKQI
ncbi:LOW QUALITY PROTEIN: hypothetical protein ACHAWF_013730 [Thalassiosira exigua]